MGVLPHSLGPTSVLQPAALEQDRVLDITFLFIQPCHAQFVSLFLVFKDTA